MTRTPPPTYADRVEAARTAVGLTVTGLAEQAGMTRYNLQKILSGRTNRLTLAAARPAVAKAMGELAGSAGGFLVPPVAAVKRKRRKKLRGCIRKALADLED